MKEKDDLFLSLQMCSPSHTHTYTSPPEASEGARLHCWDSWRGLLASFPWLLPGCQEGRSHLGIVADISQGGHRDSKYHVGRCFISIAFSLPGLLSLCRGWRGEGKIVSFCLSPRATLCAQELGSAFSTALIRLHPKHPFPRLSSPLHCQLPQSHRLFFVLAEHKTCWWRSRKKHCG